MIKRLLPILALMMATQTHAQTWQDTVDAARGQTVYWHAWGGDPRTNNYIDWVDAQMQALSEFLLGVFIVAGCGAMMLRPVPRETRSPGWGFALAGAGGGLLAGLFAAAGPVLGWFLYRQPWPHGTIRATLLACFAVSTVVRTALVGSAGGLTLEVFRFAAISLFAVLLAALLLWRWPPALEEQQLRRGAFTLLTLSGLAIVIRAAPAVF